MPKHFIAALGTSCYNTCNYKLADQTVTTSFVQEALLTMLGFGQGDKVTILLTDFARKKNWEDGTYQNNDISALQRFASEGETLPSEGDKKEGLHSILQKKFGDITINVATIPDGKSEDEIWKTFEIIYKQIEENDTIYFDITNGFRSLQMLAMTILSYSKVLKNVQIKGIYYGALEAKDKAKGTVPIFDLTASDTILNWTIAADNFIHYGNSDVIGKLCKNSSDKAFAKAWRNKLQKIVNLTNCIETSRGMERETSSNKENSIKLAYMDFKNATLEVQHTDSVEKIVLPLYEKIEDRAAVFYKKSNFEIGMATVEWSIANGMIQQGFTALLETIKTFLCNQYEMNEHEYECRDLVVAKVLHVVRLCNSAMKEEIVSVEQRKQALEGDTQYQDFIKSFETDASAEKIREYKEKGIQLAYELPRCLAILYGKIGDFRNDMNHFGFKKQPMKPDTLRKQLKKCYEEFCCISRGYNQIKLK